MSITPPLKSHGGKYYLAKKVLELMPRHLYYVEPYFGAGQVFFARDPADQRLWWPGLTSDGRKADGVIETVNDLDGNLINFYRVLQDPGKKDQLLRRLDLTLFSEAEFGAARTLLASEEGDPVERAAALFVLIRQSRQALRKDFATPVRTRLRGGRADHVNAWWGAIDGLEDAHLRIADAMILCRPALEVIWSEDTEETHFYFDPTYLHATRTARKAYGKFEMTDRDHMELLDTIRQCRGMVTLSGYDNELYNRVLTSWNKHFVGRPNNASGAGTKRRMVEVLWCNHSGRTS
jgi:DNA adenine methylase